jgi:hypothetical protein
VAKTFHQGKDDVMNAARAIGPATVVDGETMGAVLDLVRHDDAFIDIPELVTYQLLAEADLGAKYFLVIDPTIVGGVWEVTVGVDRSYAPTDAEFGQLVLAAHLTGSVDSHQGNIRGRWYVDTSVSSSRRGADIIMYEPADFVVDFHAKSPHERAWDHGGKMWGGRPSEKIVKALPESARGLRKKLRGMRSDPVPIAIVNGPEELRRGVNLDRLLLPRVASDDGGSWDEAIEAFNSSLNAGLNSIVDTLFKDHGGRVGSLLGYRELAWFGELPQPRRERDAERHSPEIVMQTAETWKDDCLHSLARIARVFPLPGDL